MDVTELLTTTSEQIANNWKDNITEAPTRVDYLYRMEAMDLSVNLGGDGRYEVIDGVKDEPTADWIKVFDNASELYIVLALLVTKRMQAWLAAQGDSWKKEVEAIY